MYKVRFLAVRGVTGLNPRVLEGVNPVIFLQSAIVGRVVIFRSQRKYFPQGFRVYPLFKSELQLTTEEYIEFVQVYIYWTLKNIILLHCSRIYWTLKSIQWGNSRSFPIFKFWSLIALVTLTSINQLGAHCGSSHSCTSAILSNVWSASVLQ